MHLVDFIMPYNFSNDIILKVKYYSISLKLRDKFINNQRITNKRLWTPPKDDWINLNTFGVVKLKEKVE